MYKYLASKILATRNASKTCTPTAYYNRSLLTEDSGNNTNKISKSRAFAGQDWFSFE